MHLILDAFIKKYLNTCKYKFKIINNLREKHPNRSIRFVPLENSNDRKINVF